MRRTKSQGKGRCGGLCSTAGAQRRVWTNVHTRDGSGLTQYTAVCTKMMQEYSVILMVRRLYLRIEVHFFCLHWEMKGYGSLVNLVKREVLLKDLHGISVLSFPNANKRELYFNTYIYSKWEITPKIEKLMSIFGHVTGVFHWKTYATVF